MNRDPVAGEVVSLVVVARQDVAVVQAHQPGRLARGYEPRAYLLAVNHHDHLA